MKLETDKIDGSACFHVVFLSSKVGGCCIAAAGEFLDIFADHDTICYFNTSTYVMDQPR
jgi:hypothetical protein